MLESAIVLSSLGYADVRFARLTCTIIKRFRAKWNSVRFRREHPAIAEAPEALSLIARPPAVAPAFSARRVLQARRRQDWHRRAPTSLRAEEDRQPAQRCRSGFAFPSHAIWQRSSDAG